MTIKEKPIAFAISSITLISMVIGGILTIDTRYAKAADIEAQQKVIESTAKQNKIEFNYSIDQLRKQMIEDKIFELDLIGDKKRSQADNARLEKFKRDLNTIDNKWQNKPQ